MHQIDAMASDKRPQARKAVNLGLCNFRQIGTRTGKGPQRKVFEWNVLGMQKFRQGAVAAVKHDQRVESPPVQAGDQRQGRLVAATDGITDKRIADRQHIGNVKLPWKSPEFSLSQAST